MSDKQSEGSEDDVGMWNEEKYPIATAIGNAPIKLASGLRSIPSTLFNARSDVEDSAFKKYINETPTNAAEGLFKGVLCVGNGFYQGVTGVFVEPVRQARKDGAIGFAKGVGKGLAGVVLKPVAGVIDLAGKTTQGIINTPITVYEAIKAKQEQDQLQQMVVSKKDGKIFGIPVEDSFKYCDHADIPHITTEAMRYLIDYVEEEGLFRISGNSHVILGLKELFDKGNKVELESKDTAYGPAEIAGLLKLYLRSLPEPLLTYVRYNNFLYIHQTEKPENKLQAYKELINTLPTHNKILLIQLMKLLKIVAANSEKNLMKSKNLATVFGPALLNKEDGVFKNNTNGTANPQQMFLEVTLSIGVVCDMIDNFDYLFRGLDV